MSLKFRNKDESNYAQEQDVLTMTYSDKFDTYLTFLLASNRFFHEDTASQNDDFSYKLLAYDDLITSKLKSARPRFTRCSRAKAHPKH